METQLIGADTLEVRHTVDGAYEQIVQIMFESLQQMAKMSDVQEAGGGEDKGVLNFHVILIGAQLIIASLGLCSLFLSGRSAFAIREYALLYCRSCTTRIGGHARLLEACARDIRRQPWGVCQACATAAYAQNHGSWLNVTDDLEAPDGRLYLSRITSMG